MSQICFAEQPRDLYVEVFMRGFVAASRDYPRLKSFEESVLVAHTIPNMLRPLVCCIDEYPYRHLVVYAWSWGYWTLCQAPESLQVQAVLSLASVPEDEAYRIAHDAFAQDDVTELEKAYTCYLTFCRTPA